MWTAQDALNALLNFTDNVISSDNDWGAMVAVTKNGVLIQRDGDYGLSHVSFERLSSEEWYYVWCGQRCACFKGDRS